MTQFHLCAYAPAAGGDGNRMCQGFEQLAQKRPGSGHSEVVWCDVWETSFQSLEEILANGTQFLRLRWSAPKAFENLGRQAGVG